jgi:hypothetical protein
VEPEPSTLLGLRVLHNRIELGRVVEVVRDSEDRPLGYEVRCGDGVSRFLPAFAGTVGDAAIVVYSPLALMDQEQARFYKRRRTGDTAD